MDLVIIYCYEGTRILEISQPEKNESTDGKKGESTSAENPSALRITLH